MFVDDQAKALAFYTDNLGFVPKNDIPLGEFRWLTVTAPGVPDGAEPTDHSPAKGIHVRARRRQHSRGPVRRG